MYPEAADAVSVSVAAWMSLDADAGLPIRIN
jgi:hypothetical protein